MAIQNELRAVLESIAAKGTPGELTKQVVDAPKKSGMSEASTSSRVMARYQKIHDHLKEKKDDIGLGLLNDMMDALGL